MWYSGHETGKNKDAYIIGGAMNIRRSLLLKLIVVFLNIFINITHTHSATKPALVVVPAADLVGRPMSESDIIVTYDNIPIASGKFKRGQLCPRLHQLIFNEIVDITTEQSNEARINISNVYYLAKNNGQPQTAYWTLKKNLMPLEIIEKKGLDLNKIPKPVEFSDNGLALHQANTITLILPWTDKNSQRTYSVGTRFVLAENSKKGKHYSIYLFDPEIMNFRQAHVAKNLAIENSRTYSNPQRVALFVQLLRRWAHHDNGLIPYVWGGCSFTATCKDLFEKKECGAKGPGMYYYIRKDIQDNPCVGFDCSGMIARAAQTCGIPYFFKNTTTLACKLAPIEAKDTLHEGDLFWFPGHVMVVASIPNNTLIEARGYGTGYGKVHEIALSNMFRDISSYRDLLNAYFNAKPLILLNEQQENQCKLSDYKILKLAGVWN